MKNIEIIAFFLPQYHRVKENDEWYGEGFTEWTNVRMAKPLFRGHNQPIKPGELGYYDLLDPKIRDKQSELAKSAGVSAFCYYHYWFGDGRQLLETPLKEVVRLQKPDMPFCICWANHRWLKKTWNPETSVLDQVPLLSINYGDEADWRLHFNTLLPMFKDSRYYKIDGRLAFVLYRIQDIKNVKRFMAVWDELAVANNLPMFYWINYVDDEVKLKDPIQNICDSRILMLKDNITSIAINSIFIRKIFRFLKSLYSQLFNRPIGVYSYPINRKKLLSARFYDESVIPTLIPNWDNTARRHEGATVLAGSCPEQFYLHCKEVFSYVKEKKNKVVFLKSWNEWGEGNYIEPDDKFGRGWIYALRKALNDFTD